MDNIEKFINNSDEEIIKLSLTDSNFYSIIVKRYEIKLSNYIRRLCSCSFEDIEDLLQEIFIKAFKSLNEFDTSLKFSSWIYRIAHNEVISHYRKTQSRPISLELFPNAPIADHKSDNILKQLDSSLNKKKIITVLLKMDIKYKEVLVLRYFEEKNYEEISDILKKPVGTVSTLLNRAKKNFIKTSKSLNIKF